MVAVLRDPLCAVAPPVSLSSLQPMLGAFVRSLWDTAPAFLALTPDDDGVPYLTPDAVHLPALADRRDDYRAMAAHTAAHRVYSAHRFERAGLAPITQALIGLLEDARVECLACRELPGLRRLWLPWHTADASLGDGFEALMQRLARALIDARYADPHPWIAKGRRLFFADESIQSIALCRPADLRRAASLLGHDIGQMRLSFNARLCRVQPGYRDDHRHLWPMVEREVGAAAVAPAIARPAPAVIHRHAEWDGRIGRYRRDWTTLHSRAAAPGDAAPLLAVLQAERALTRRLRTAMRAGAALSRRIERRLLQGPLIDLRQQVRDLAAQRAGRPDEGRSHARRQPQREPVSWLLLIDGSASTARPFGTAATTGTLLDAMRRAAAHVALAAAAVGDRCAIHGFCSDGRHAVHDLRVKGFDECFDSAAMARLAGLRSGLSTRLGAALRCATAALAAQPGRRRLLLLTDGEPHDIDVHDPRYLRDDARRAVAEARQAGLGVTAWTFDAATLDELTGIVGRGHGVALPSLGVLPQAWEICMD